MKKTLFVLALAAATCAPAFATERDQATLVAHSGAVTASTGGVFGEAGKGHVLSEGDRLMLVDKATATLRYDNGCRIHYDQPGVYVVPDREGCAALLPRTTGVDWAGAAKIATGVAVTAALLHSMDEIPPPPVSR